MTTSPTKAGATEPAFAQALRPRPLFDTDEPDYSDEAPLPDNAYADCAAADWWAGRTR